MVYKNSFSLMAYALLVVLAVTHERDNRPKKDWLDVPNIQWEKIHWEQGDSSLNWQYLDLQGGVWVLNIGTNGLAVQINQKKFNGVLEQLTKKIPLDLVTYRVLGDQELTPFGLSKDLRTVVTLIAKGKSSTVILGNRTAGGHEIYILKNGRVFKGRLDFIFQLVQSLYNMPEEKTKRL